MCEPTTLLIAAGVGLLVLFNLLITGYNYLIYKQSYKGESLINETVIELRARVGYLETRLTQLEGKTKENRQQFY